eukprot:3714943-Amphidinium_carterae.1
MCSNAFKCLGGRGMVAPLWLVLSRFLLAIGHVSAEFDQPEVVAICANANFFRWGHHIKCIVEA